MDDGVVDAEVELLDVVPLPSPCEFLEPEITPTTIAITTATMSKKTITRANERFILCPSI